MGLVWLRLTDCHPIEPLLSSSAVPAITEVVENSENFEREAIEPTKTKTENSIQTSDVHNQNSLIVNNVDNKSHDDTRNRSNRKRSNSEEKKHFDPISYLTKYGYMNMDRVNHPKRGSLIMYPPGDLKSRFWQTF